MAAPILIAGAGVAGLTAALAFAERGFTVRVFERSSVFRDIGAGIQLSPNATRILRRLGVLPLLESTAVRPSAVVLRSARSLREIARVRLGMDAETRWGAPYLVLHRSDLQAALLAAVQRVPSISLSLGSSVTGVSRGEVGVTIALDSASAEREIYGALLVVADGVWSRLRSVIGDGRVSKFSGDLAWRRTIKADGDSTIKLVPNDSVSAFLSRGFHLIAYPIRSGGEINLVAITSGKNIAADWSAEADPKRLSASLGKASPVLAALADDMDRWRAYPIHTVDPRMRWTSPGLALIGDAAHAMTPYAAQGAAMAIEDADLLAATVSAAGPDLAASLPFWEAERRTRIDRVRDRGAFNRFAWHAFGPIGLARDVVLALRSPERLAADMDWLYGYGDTR